MRRAWTGIDFLAGGMAALSTLLMAGCASDGSSSGTLGSGGSVGSGGGSGLVSCPVGFETCGAECVDTQTNNSNCGTCGIPCGAGSTCVGGLCTCAAGTADCGTGVCVDTTSNATNCGACSVACSVPAESCTNSVCACATGYESCAVGCVNPQTDPANCGTCANVCAAPLLCSQGTCTDTCATGLVACGQSCVDTQTDPAHCGDCATVCGASQACVAGACQCESGLTSCNGTCLNVQIDNANCGACGTVCGAGQACTAGVCTCTTAGQTACSGVCTDTQTDASNCGTCGTPCASGVCQAGVCTAVTTGTGGASGTGGSSSATGGAATSTGGAATSTGGTTAAGGSSGTGGATAGTGGAAVVCTTGETDCWGACVDVLTDPEHCGTCGNVCPTGVCNSGVCPPVKDCYVKTVIESPLLSDFEDYDGTEPLTDWGFAFNATAGTEGAVYAGPFEYNDATGTPTLGMVTGYESVYALNVANPNASGWGGALGLWMSCIDATAFEGISFWVQGSSPTGTVNMTLAMEATSPPNTDEPLAGGTCTADDCAAANMDIPVTSTWTLLQIPWASFTPGVANAAQIPVTGDNITGITFNVPLVFAEDPNNAGTWVATPSAYSFSVDDIQFLGSGVCGGTEILCGVGCTDTSTDAQNCGACGTVCSAERTCVAGACVCPDGYTDCDGECVDLMISAQNCGSCGNQCSGQCSGGTCAASSCTSGMTPIGTTSTAYDQIFLGKYWLNNNQWGASEVSGTQSIWYTCNDGNTIGWGTEWNWPAGSGGVKSYASSVLGWHWGWEEDNGNVTTTGLSRQLSSNPVITCGWTYTVDPGGIMNVAYDLWTHSTSHPDYQGTPTHEVMIWLYYAGGAGPIGSQVASNLTIDGTVFNLWEGTIPETGVQVHSFIRANPSETGDTLNIMSFLNTLVDRGSMATSQYLTSIEAGTEIFSGTGRLDTSAYYCTIQ